MTTFSATVSRGQTNTRLLISSCSNLSRAIVCEASRMLPGTSEEAPVNDN